MNWKKIYDIIINPTIEECTSQENAKQLIAKYRIRTTLIAAITFITLTIFNFIVAPHTTIVDISGKETLQYDAKLFLLFFIKCAIIALECFPLIKITRSYNFKYVYTPLNTDKQPIFNNGIQPEQKPQFEHIDTQKVIACIGTIVKNIAKYIHYTNQIRKEYSKRKAQYKREQQKAAAVQSVTVLQKTKTIDELTGIEFEEWCCKLLSEHGFTDIKTTPVTGDQGVDILATYNNEKYAIQCKCYSSRLDNTPIQEVYAGMVHYKCQKSMVITNNYFTNGALELAQSTKTILWDRNVLKNMLFFK